MGALRCAGVAAALLSLLAEAEGARSRVLVVPVAPADPLLAEPAARLTRALTEATRARDDRLELVVAPERTRSATGPLPAFEKAAAEGKAAADGRRFEEAAAAWERAVNEAWTAPHEIPFEAFARAHIGWAEAWFRQGENRRAQEVLVALLRVAPEVTLGSEYPPVFVREFDRARKRLERLPRATVNVVGPDASSVLLDGRALGNSPQSVQVIVGRHWVAAELEGGARVGQAIDVRPGGQTVRLGAPEAAGPVAFSTPVVFDTPDTASLRAWCEAHGADFALISALYAPSRSELEASALLYSLAEDGFVEIPRAHLDVEMKTAGVESYKWVDEVAARTAAFKAMVELPFHLVPIVRHKVVEPLKPPPPPVWASAQGAPPAATVESSSRVPSWVWVTVGVVAIAGAGVGGYFGYREATRPVTGTVTATW